MGKVTDSFERRMGRNIADRVSNAVFGDKWARPYKRVADEARADAIRERAEAQARAAQTRANAIALEHETRAEIAEKNQLNAIDAAVIANVDKVIAMPFESDPNRLAEQLNGLVIQLSMNSFSKETQEEKIRAKYTEAVFQKLEQGLNLLLATDPYNPHIQYIYDGYVKALKQRRKGTRKFMLIMWGVVAWMLVVGIMSASEGEPGFLIAALITLCVAIIITIIRHLISIKHSTVNSSRIRKARRTFDEQQQYQQIHTERIEQETSPSFNINTKSAVPTIVNRYQTLWQKYAHLSPLFRQWVAQNQHPIKTNTLIVNLYHMPNIQDEYKDMRDVCWLDLFPIKASSNKEIMKGIITNPQLFEYVKEQISLDQDVIEDIVHPQLIIVAHQDAYAFFGKLPQFVWMGYQFEFIQQTPSGDLCRITGFRSEERIQNQRIQTNLIGTKVLFHYQNSNIIDMAIADILNIK